MSADGLTKTLGDLRSKVEDVRNRAAKSLRLIVEDQSRELNGESFSRLHNSIISKIADLVNSTDASDRLGAVAAIDQLIDIDCDEHATRVTRFGNYLRNMLPNPDYVLVGMVARALGRLARAGGTLTADLVEFETKRALEWLQSDRAKDESKRFAACCVLKELAENAPTLFYAHVSLFLDHIWNALRDQNVVVREKAVESLRACLALIAERESRWRVQWYYAIYDEAEKGFKMKSEAIHASLLTVLALLDHAGDFMTQRFPQVLDSVFKYKDHKEKIVRRTVVLAMPQCARYNPKFFTSQYLKTAVNHVLSFTLKKDDKALAFSALGDLALACGRSILAHLDPIIAAVKENLSGKKSRNFCPEILTCISNFAKACGADPSLEIHLMQILDSMFSGGLSSTLTSSLATLSSSIPSLSVPISDRLLDLISRILARTSYRIASLQVPAQVGSSVVSSSSSHQTLSTLANSVPLPSSMDDDEDGSVDTIRLALHTLGSFELSEHSLMDFVRHCVVRYLEEEDSEIRKEAALTCAHVLSRHGRAMNENGLESALYFTAVRAEILEKLLAVAISDPQSSIRKAILSSLDSSFDSFLALSENLRCLFMALNDENFDNRIMAVEILGRLSLRNPAYVLPSLRKSLIQLLTELEFSIDARSKEESASLLGHLISAAPRLVKPYVPAALSVLLMRLKDPSPAVSSACLATLGLLATVGGETMKKDLPILLPLIMETLSDQGSSNKREVALRTLSLLVESTGEVIRPYVSYPQLMPLLLSLMKSEETYTIRKEAMRCLGVLGALDPVLLESAVGGPSGSVNSGAWSSRKGIAAISNAVRTAAIFPTGGAVAPIDEDESHPNTMLVPSAEDFYPTVAISALVKILRDSSLSAHHKACIEAIMFIFKSLGLRGVPFLPKVLPPFLFLIRSTGDVSLRQSLLQQLGLLVSIVKHHIRNFLNDILVLVQEMWHKNVLIQMVSLVEEIANALHEEFKSHLPSLLPKLLSVFSPLSTIGGAPTPSGSLTPPSQPVISMSSDDPRPIFKVLEALQIFGRHLDEYLYMVIPAIMRIIESTDFHPSVRIAAVQCLSRLSRLSSFPEHASRIVHPLCRVMAITDCPVQLRAESMDCLCCLVEQMGPEFALFIPVVSKIISPISQSLHGGPSGGGNVSTSSSNDKGASRSGSSSSGGPSASAFQRYEELVAAILNNQPIGPRVSLFSNFSNLADDDLSPLDTDSTADVPLVPMIAVGPGGKDVQVPGRQEFKDDLQHASHGFEQALQGSAASNANLDMEAMFIKKLHVNQANLRKAWEASQRSTREDWNEWIRRFSVELLRESPSPALRSCWSLAQLYPPLARALFNASFLSCWTELYDHFQDEVVRAIEMTFSSPNLPGDVLMVLLGLAEFMEHDERQLPIDIGVLGTLAERCQAFAKALHYKELEFSFQQQPSSGIQYADVPNTANGASTGSLSRGGSMKNLNGGDGRSVEGNVIEALISINNQLHHHEAAMGILIYAQKHAQKYEIKESWFEKLQKWEDALRIYEEKHKTDPLSVDYALGRMRCLEALGEWEQLFSLCVDVWTTSDNHTRRRVAPMAASAAFHLSEWPFMSECVEALESETFKAAFFRAILNTHAQNFEAAQSLIDRARKFLDAELTALLNESYPRAYDAVVRVQQLVELEEILAFKKKSSGMALTQSDTMLGPESSGFSVDDAQFIREKESLKRIWSSRLLGCQRNVDHWQELLHLRSLVLDVDEQLDLWLKFSRLCRKTGKMRLAHKLLIVLCKNHDFIVDPEWLISAASSSSVDPKVVMCCLEHLWSAQVHERQRVYKLLSNFVRLIDVAVDNYRPTLKQGTSVPAAPEEEYADVSSPAPKASQPLEEDADVGSANPAASSTGPTHGFDQSAAHLRAHAFMYLGQWHRSLMPDDFDVMLGQFRSATIHDPTWYKAWHAWATLNADMVDNLAGKASAATPGSDASQNVSEYARAAVAGFFKSISFGSSKASRVQDILRLLTLWFRYGGDSNVYVELVRGFDTLSVDTWLLVIPQLIARLHLPEGPVRELLHTLLTKVGHAHPQALIYPLTVAAKSTSENRRHAATRILEHMRQNNSRLVEQALLVSTELIRIAVLWHEQWHEGLEEASRLYFGDHNVDGMFAVLSPLHAMMAAPETLREIAFQQQFGRDLAEAKDWCKKYRRTRNDADLNQAWDLYYHVFRRINKQLPGMSTLELQHVSPALLYAKNLELAIPGSYHSFTRGQNDDNLVTIAGFAPSLQVINSKQRPRKLTIFGSDGREHVFLLKGHEDLRQDERVMQLFGLVNTLLAASPPYAATAVPAGSGGSTSPVSSLFSSGTNVSLSSPGLNSYSFSHLQGRVGARADLSIERMAVVPLNQSAGLIGWLQDCDTLHSLIREYREARKILLNIEHRLILKMAGDFDNLALLQKVEVFEHALENTTGQDLHKVLWLKSRSSEVWLERRTNYSRSLAVMSMVGYILGLGDRHPSNLMLHRNTGKVVHIDFGDCFEVAQHRDKYPEKVPFRLTRMLINAMEVSGIEGTYRFTCNYVMRVLRHHKDSLMAMLEAFVHDPLINWRLLDTDKAPSMVVDDLDESRSLIEPEASIPASISSVNGGREQLRKQYEDENLGGESNELLNKKALSVVQRIRDKLTGNDFDRYMDVEEQVERLIQQATSHVNLCQAFIGWCSFW
eukprot:ANDGO_06658.mRNA.1 Serine/threonine-protein kinase TOR2